MKFLNYFKSQKESGFDLNLLPDGIFVIEQDGKIADVNDKILKMFSINRFEIIGKYFSSFVQDGLVAINKVLADGSTIIVKAIIKNEDDEANPRLFLELSASRDTIENKVYVTARNTTDKQQEQKQINEKYDMAQKIIDGKNDFILESSGSILSTLVSISGFSRALLDGIGGILTEKQQKYLKIINTNSNDLKYDLEKLFNLFELESGKIEYKNKSFDLISLLKSIDRIYEKEFKDKKIVFSMDYSGLTQRDCELDSEIVELILRSIMDIFSRFSTFGKCSLNIGHPPVNFLKDRDFAANDSLDTEKYALFEAKITDIVFTQEELDNIFNIYYKSPNKRPIGLRATFNLLKRFVTDFRGDIWVYSKQSFGTMITFVLPLR